jgi:hypothetical protein
MAKNEKGSNLDIETVMQGDDSTSSSPDSFFGQLEDKVNGAIVDEISPTGTQQVTSEKSPSLSGDSKEPQVEQPQVDNTDWKKRYSDSTREAQTMAAKLKKLEPLNPLLKVMEKDPNLIPYIKDYLESGGKPDATVQSKLKLDEDFVFDGHEAVTNPESDSAKVMSHMVNQQVEERMKTHVKSERQRVQQAQIGQRMKAAEEDFKGKHGLTNEQFKDFQDKAKGYKMTLDDAYWLVNRDKVQQNIANNTKEDTLRQMKNVRNIPQSNSGTNNAGSVNKSEGDKLLDALKSVDGGLNIFGE